MQQENSTQALSYDDMDESQQLYVRSATGRYKVATNAQVLATARVAAENLITKHESMSNPLTVKRFFQAKLSGMGHEVFSVLFLNSQNKIIRYMEMGQGTLTQASVYPREVVKTALRLNSAALIISHNHPSGVAEPSQADLMLTKQLKQALALIDVRLLDHIIVTANSTNSLAENGLM